MDLQLLLSFALCIGLLLSYIPQHYRIIRLRSSKGLSAPYLALGGIGAYCASANVLLLTLLAHADDPPGPGEKTLYALWSRWSSVTQVLLQTLMFSITIVLYAIYYPTQSQQSHGQSTYKSDQLIIKLSLFIPMAATGMLGLLLLPPYKRLIVPTAHLLALASSLLACLQYIPQILLTYTEKAVGALSIPTMLIQSPGSALFVYTLYGRPGTDWTSWAPYATSGLLQAFLCALCISYEHIAPGPISLPDDAESSEQRGIV